MTRHGVGQVPRPLQGTPHGRGEAAHGSLRVIRIATNNTPGNNMLHYAVVFLVIALIAAVFGFGGIAAGAAGIAKILFVVFLIGAIISFVMHGRSRV
jgi:uncharacterized membrane protein YtjA (UPF0391 family)